MSYILLVPLMLVVRMAVMFFVKKQNTEIVQSVAHRDRTGVIFAAHCKQQNIDDFIDGLKEKTQSRK